MLVFLLPNYSIISLSECPIPQRVGGLFAMLSPGHVSFNNAPEPIVRMLLQRTSVESPPRLSASELQQSMKLGVRELGKFEHQLFAMNRLCADGEKALAIIGTLALLEWYLNSSFADEPKNSKKPKRQESLSVLLRNGHLDFLPEATCRRLLEASHIRNALVHGSPPERYSLNTTNAKAGQETEYQGNSISSGKVREIIQTALDVYRNSNLHRSGRS
jgi:hypothetical protein